MSLLIETTLLLFYKLPLSIIFGILSFIFPLFKKDVQGEVILVTGAGHGIGRSLAIKFASLGAKLVLWDINKKGCEETRDEIISHGGTAFSYLCDVTDVEAVKETAKLVRENVGTVTYLINNAGIFNGQQILDLSVNQVRRCIDINLTSHFWTIKEFLPSMLKWNNGHIIAISSVAGFNGFANASDYAGSKFGVRGLMSCVEEEIHEIHGKDGVKVSVVCPGFVDTGIAKHPVVRFPKLTGIVPIDEAADDIIDGILRELPYIYVKQYPGAIVHFLLGVLPHKASQLVVRFGGMRIGAHK